METKIYPDLQNKYQPLEWLNHPEILQELNLEPWRKKLIDYVRSHPTYALTINKAFDKMMKTIDKQFQSLFKDLDSQVPDGEQSTVISFTHDEPLNVILYDLLWENIENSYLNIDDPNDYEPGYEFADAQQTVIWKLILNKNHRDILHKYIYPKR